MDEAQINRGSDSSASFDSLEFPELVKPNERIVKLNQEVLETLQATLKLNPEMNLLAIFPEDYSQRRQGKLTASTASAADAQRLGGLDGEGVKNDFMFGHRSSEVMTTAAEFDDFQFSACPRASKAWVTFLRSFLPVQSEDCVFTHGGVWMANIMVKLDDSSSNYTVSGLIDWENSSFYPESQESIRMLSGLTRYTETDWYKHVPPCVSPKRYAVHWLVHRLWSHTVDST
ncbi:hypothetical protein VE04_03569 [Pseudogymnoascus sp. 24MN13]|nr:hypothetical protein VE04_03569 [Pseudogymnoascus sp. 24MN13]